MSQQLLYILLGVALVIFVVMMIRDWRISQNSKQRHTQNANANKTSGEITLTLCLQAYERLVLFLERIKPEILIGRVSQPGLTAQEMRGLLTSTVQSEFEHNLSQQIYVSTPSWKAVCNAKEQLISLINSLADRLPPDAKGMALNKKLLELSLKENELPVATALEILNAEAKKLINSST